MRGSKWFQCDFHLHTASSKCFIEDSNLELWVEKVVDQGLDCIAVTNHNSPIGIGDLQQKCLENDIALFPGVELTCSNAKVHLLILFEVNTAESTVSDFIVQSGIRTESFGDEDAFTDKSISEVADLANSFNAIVIAAHIDQYSSLRNVESRGSLDDFFGKENVLGVQITRNPSDYDVEADVGALRVMEFVEKHSISKLTFSDNPSDEDPKKHGISGIGKSRTYIKMSEKPSLRSLRQALIMQDLRVVTDLEYDRLPKKPDVYIEEIKIEGAHLFKDIQLQLNTGVNAFIGGRGSGKSAFIRLLRLALNRVADIEDYPDIKLDFNSFFDSFDSPVGGNAIIEVVIVNGENKYKIILSKIKKTTNVQRLALKLVDGSFEPIEITKMDDVLANLDIEIYSQKQLYALSQSPNHILDILDKKDEDVKELKKEVASLVRELNHACIVESKIREEVTEVNIAEENLSNIDVKIKTIESALEGSLDNFLVKKEHLKNVNDLLLKTFKDFLDVKNNISNSIVSVEKEILSEDNLFLLEKEGMISIRDNYEKNRVELKGKLEDAFNSFRSQLKDEFVEFVKSDFWLEKKKNRSEYLEILKGDHGKELDGLLKEKKVALESVKKKEDISERTEECISLIKEKFNNVVNKYSELRLSRERIINDYIPDEANLKITFDSHKNLFEFESRLRSKLGLSPDTFKDDLQKVCEFLQRTHNVDEKLFELIEKISNKEENTLDLSAKFLNKFNKENFPSKYELLELLPPDNIKIKFIDRTDGSEYDLSKGSHGQKTSAVLSILLHVNNSLKIIDQPEDDLDNSLIYGLVVNNILCNKNSKQMIIVTHNANIPVNGDADLIVSMGSSSRKIKVNNAGELDNEQLRDEVCSLMEGGPEAFLRRAKKYGLN
jgi:DNA repair ATPase RecN